jgi:hypothetical protein
MEKLTQAPSSPMSNNRPRTCAEHVHDEYSSPDGVHRDVENDVHALTGHGFSSGAQVLSCGDRRASRLVL